MKRSSLSRFRARIACTTTLFLGAFAGLVPAAEDKPASPLQSLDYSGSQQPIEAVDRDLVAAGKDPAKLAALETRLLDTLRKGDLTFAARQAICQRLGAVLAQTPPKTADAYKPLAAMLTDERDSDLARLALEPAPGEVVDALFVTALGKSTGRPRLGITYSLGRRRAASAVPGLTPLLKDKDAATVAAAARALGEIADAAAIAALRAINEPSPAPIAEAKLAAAARTQRTTSEPLLADLQRAAANPAHRAAAARMLIDEQASTTAIVTALGGSDWTPKQVTLDLVTTSRAPELIPAISAKFASFDPPTQSAVLAAFARRGDAAAVPAVLTALRNQDADVRRAALTALGFLPGNREVATQLANVAAGPDSDDAKLARQTLARLNGPDVSAAILEGAERAPENLRVVYLEQVAARNLGEGLPLLLKLRTDPSATIRTAAVGALGDLAPATEEKALLDWTIGAKDEAEQTRALRSLVNVILRNPDAAARGRVFYAALDQASPDVSLRLLPALARLGGKASAEAAARLAVRSDAKTADAATSALARWTDDTALPALATIVEKAGLPSARQAALEGALRYFERNREPWTPASTDVLSRLLAATKETDARQRLVALLNRANDKKALALAESLKGDATVGASAATAVDVIRANLAGQPRLRASGATGNLKNILDGKPSTRWSVAANGEEWVEVDFRVSRPLHRITLDQSGRGTEFPEKYAVYVTDDVAQPGAVRASGPGQRNKTVIELPPNTRGRYLIIKNTAERKDVGWSIAELYVD